MSVHRDAEHALCRAGVYRELTGERRLEIAPGTECPVARAGEDADQCVVVSAEAVSRIDELSMCLRPNGVHTFRPSDGDDRDGTALLIDEMLVVAHRDHSSR